MHSPVTSPGENRFHLHFAAKHSPTRSDISFRTLCLLVLTAVLAVESARAQTETVLHSFTGNPDGANSDSRLTPDGLGNFYGTTTYGGQFGAGSVFELSPNGSGGYNEIVIYSFCSQTNCADGENPTFSFVTLDDCGNIFGTTWAGGSEGVGTVFELKPSGGSWTEVVLHNFLHNMIDGYNPVSGLIMDLSKNLYGTTFNGGGGDGSIYKLSPDGSGGWTEQVIYDACMGYAGINMDSHGNIFAAGCSTLFELSPNGSGGWNATNIHFFEGGTTDGGTPNGTPVISASGEVYGTAIGGGTKNDGVVYRFKFGKKGWQERIIHSFGSGKDGNEPWAGMTFSPSGNLYGTTVKGGKYGYGTVYEIAVSGNTYKEKVLWSFNNNDGAAPTSAVIWNSHHLYGTTANGGDVSCSDGCGVAFEVIP